MIVLILGTLLVLALVALQRDRVWSVLQTIILILTGGVLIAPLRNALQGVIGPLGRFMRAALDYGDAGSSVEGSQMPPAAPTSGVQTEPATPTSAGNQTSEPTPTAASPAPTPRPTHHLNRILAAVVLTAITVVLGVFDYEFIHLTFAALWGLPAAESVSAGRTVLTSLALMASLLLWGLIALELGGYTHFMRDFPTSLRRVLKYMTIAAFVVGLSSALMMGIWRARAMEDAPIEPAPMTATIADSGVISAESEPTAILVEETTGLDSFAPIYLSAAIPVLVLVSSAVSFTGVLWLAKYIAILGLWICLVPLAVIYFWILPTWDNAIAHLLQGVETVVDVLAWVGKSIVDTLGPPLRAMRVAIHRKIGDWTGVATAAEGETSAPSSSAPDQASRAPSDGRPGSERGTTEHTSAHRTEAGPARDLNWDF